MSNILNNPAFLKELIHIAEQLNEPYELIHQEASDCLKELHTQHQPLANAIGLEFAQYILFKGYQKTIDTNSQQIKAITKLARQHPIAFVMTHKTYLDMFDLFRYVCVGHCAGSSWYSIAIYFCWYKFRFGWFGSAW